MPKRKPIADSKNNSRPKIRKMELSSEEIGTISAAIPRLNYKISLAPESQITLGAYYLLLHIIMEKISTNRQNLITQFAQHIESLFNREEKLSQEEIKTKINKRQLVTVILAGKIIYNISRHPDVKKYVDSLIETRTNSRNQKKQEKSQKDKLDDSPTSSEESPITTIADETKAETREEPPEIPLSLSPDIPAILPIQAAEPISSVPDPSTISSLDFSDSIFDHVPPVPKLRASPGYYSLWKTLFSLETSQEAIKSVENKQTSTFS